MVQEPNELCWVIRRVLPRDCLSLWRIRNELTVRYHSTDAQPIGLVRHVWWFMRRWRRRLAAPLFVAVLVEPDEYIPQLMGLPRGEVVGYVRLDPQEPEAWLVSIALALHARGRGLGRSLVQAALHLSDHTGRRLRAEVQPQNRGAQAFFARCGFVADSDNLVWTYRPLTAGTIPVGVKAENGQPR